MGIDNAFDISVSAINAERMHMELIASNIANINTTRSVGGGPYKRKSLSYAEVPLSFSEELDFASDRLESKSGGVAAKIYEDKYSPIQRVYNPGHPDADENGYVSLPNVSLSTEMADLVYSSKLYEANISVFNATKKMAQETMQIQ